MSKDRLLCATSSSNMLRRFGGVVRMKSGFFSRSFVQHNEQVSYEQVLDEVFGD